MHSRHMHMHMHMRMHTCLSMPEQPLSVRGAPAYLPYISPCISQALSVSAAELVEAWRIFTPVLHHIDDERPQPVLRPFGP